MEPAKELRAARLQLTSDVIRWTTDFFAQEGFVQLLPALLGRSTDPLGPDPNSSVLKTASVDYNDQRFFLMNSMILHKQVAVREIGKIWILSPNVRLEHARRRSSGRHLFEFTQADFEIPGAKIADVRSLVERYFAWLSQRLPTSPAYPGVGIAPFVFRPPFASYTTHELQARFGEDWEPAASAAHDQPFWALCHRREFYDREDPDEPGHFRNYDLIYPLGYGEGLSGAEREFDYGRIHARIVRDRMDLSALAAYLDEARQGLVPSAGGGFGIERLVRFLAQAPHVGDVQLFRRVPGEPVTL